VIAGADGAIAVGAAGSGGTTAPGVGEAGDVEIRAVSLSSWKKTMLTDAKPAAVRMKFS